MSYIIGKKCVDICDTACVKSCPVDCIHGPIDIEGSGAEVEQLKKEEKLKDKQLFINPDNCINCGACLYECPVEAIYKDEEECINIGDKESVHKNYSFFNIKIPKEYK